MIEACCPQCPHHVLECRCIASWHSSHGSCCQSLQQPDMSNIHNFYMMCKCCNMDMATVDGEYASAILSDAAAPAVLLYTKDGYILQMPVTGTANSGYVHS